MNSLEQNLVGVVVTFRKKLFERGSTFFDMSTKDWLLQLKVGDEIDVLDTKYRKDHEWYIWHSSKIKAIAEISDKHNQHKFFISFNGWSSKCDKWISSIDIKDENHKDYDSMKPLHTHTPYHDPAITCKNYPRDRHYVCSKCDRKCCGICFIVHIYNKSTQSFMRSECRECFIILSYKNIFILTQLLFRSMFNKEQDIEINIIKLITNYGFETSIKCANKMKNCWTKIEKTYSRESR